MARILLLGLDVALADDLSRVLRQLGHTIRTAGTCAVACDFAESDLIFAGSDDFREAITFNPQRPVIVTSRLPEMKSWISALEAGAADYCGAPFEVTQVRWVLNTALAA
jgi:DNA-binding response OmpR family regulator